MNNEDRQEFDRVDRLVEQLREEMLDQSDGDVEADLEDHDVTFYGGLLAELPEKAFDDDALAAADRLLEHGEGIAPHHRERLVAAADRGIRYRRRTELPLQSLLEITRAERRSDAAATASSIGVSTEEFLTMESGSTPLLDVDAARVAKWIRELEVDQETALGAVERSLRLAGSGRSFGRRAPTELRPDLIAKYVAEVRAALEE
jgi:hypothetical protein